MNIDKKKISIVTLSLIGLILSIKLAEIYYTANYNAYALSSFCAINEFIDCDGAARSTSAQFWGIPLAYWGIFLYLTILFLTFVDKLKSIKFLKFLEVFKNPNSYISTIGTVAFVCSMILAWKSFFVIHKLCLLCLITYFIDLFIAIIASSGNVKTFLLSFKDTVLDFISGAKKYTKTFLVLLILATTFFTYSGVTYNLIPHMKRFRSIVKFRKITYNPYRINGNDLGPKDADVVIDLYSDFVCAHCYTNNIMLHKLVGEYKNVRVNHHNFPFDKECNKYMTYNVHPNACLMSKAAIAAMNQGNYWGMASLLHENQPQNVNGILHLAYKLNLDLKKFLADVNSPDTKKYIENEIEQIQELGLNATPSMYINEEKIIGIKPYYELKEIVEKHGARKK